MSGSSFSPKRRGLFGCLAAFLGLAGGLAAAEAVLRLSADRPTEHEVLAQLASGFEPPPLSGDCQSGVAQAKLIEILDPSEDPDLVYQLRPGAETCFEGAPVRINRQGIRRDADVTVPKPETVHRILVLGDSQAFGWALPAAATVSAQWELALGGSGTSVEVINAGVPGYNTFQEAAWLATGGTKLEPDCVVVLFVANDLGLPAFMLQSRTPGPSRLWDLIRRATGSKRWFTYASTELASFVQDNALSRVPPRYRHMVGEGGYREALQRMAELSAEEGFELVNLVDYSTLDLDTEELLAFQRGLGITALELSWPLEAEYRVSPSDPHLNSEGNAVIVDFLLENQGDLAVCLGRGESDLKLLKTDLQTPLQRSD